MKRLLSSLKKVDRITQKKPRVHLSSCAIYNEPAYPAGPCNCGYDRAIRAEQPR